VKELTERIPENTNDPSEGITRKYYVSPMLGSVPIFPLSNIDL